MKLFSKAVKTTVLAAIFCTFYMVTTEFNKPLRQVEPVAKPVVVGFAIGVTQGMLNFGLDRNELAFLISHELAHIDLGHTETSVAKLTHEYHADTMAIYYMELAGYNPCAASGFWSRMGIVDTTINPRTHPDSMRRAQYLKLARCGHYVRGPNVTAEDAYEVFTVLTLKLRPKMRNYTSFQIIDTVEDVNAYAQAIYK